MSKTWICDKRGLRKESIIDNNSQCQNETISMEKPTEISKCLVSISDIQNLNGRPSNFLIENSNGEIWIEMISAVTPIDYYFNLLLQQMHKHETSRCFIKTKLAADEEISFVLTLNDIKSNKYLFQLNPREMFDLSSKYKENGVIMFPKYPLFACEYFTRAAKFLISYKPFDVLNQKDDNVEAIDLEQLLQTLKMNISACHIKTGRYEDVLLLTEFVNESTENVVPEKAIYRRAVALHRLNRYEEAKKTLERINYNDKSECSILYKNILNDLKISNESYKKIVKKMFT